MIAGELVGELGKHLTGRHVGVPHLDRSPQANALILIDIAGSGRAAARMLGVAESTFRGWRHGVQPRGGVNQAIVSAARRLAALNSGRLAYARATTGLAIRGTFTVSKDTRTRDIYPGRQMPRATMTRILNRWAAGEDDHKVEQSLIRAIDRWYQPLQFDRIEAVWFE